uniref:Uncharacterized protein n=1 Tax=Chromera velia CCMP2878 TaxID=1169474 RepID=A0A0G4FJR0_9ALVE|eukprot:Cvel_17396.t1-p1 / transcript=Cvel_17396.t1 / gene=Cvel_17396 / organism=Chromera_velia_CCMP2878 / gene_product=hypothetical protein / transcript_product=hypothetical protein / location=Cvel_scaffold1384:37653-46562(-) / protein_length=493 / sequence_SO=supercontig / SO=protein_coding / is_pseudo=false
MSTWVNWDSEKRVAWLLIGCLAVRKCVSECLLALLTRSVYSFSYVLSFGTLTEDSSAATPKKRSLGAADFRSLDGLKPELLDADRKYPFIPKNWLQSTCALITQEQCKHDSQGIFVQSIAVVHLQRGGKTRALKEIGRFLENSIFVSFNEREGTGITGPEKKGVAAGWTTLLECLLIRITWYLCKKGRANGDFESWAERYTVKEDTITTFVKPLPSCLLLMDELNALLGLKCSDESQKENLYCFIKSHFYVIEARMYVFSSHNVVTTYDIERLEKIMSGCNFQDGAAGTPSPSPHHPQVGRRRYAALGLRLLGLAVGFAWPQAEMLREEGDDPMGNGVEDGSCSLKESGGVLSRSDLSTGMRLRESVGKEGRRNRANSGGGGERKGKRKKREPGDAAASALSLAGANSGSGGRRKGKHKKKKPGDAAASASSSVGDVSLTVGRRGRDRKHQLEHAGDDADTMTHEHPPQLLLSTPRHLRNAFGCKYFAGDLHA